MVKVQAQGKDSKVIEKEDFHFGVPGFRAHSKVIMIVAALYYIGTLAFSLPNQYFRYIFFVSLAFALDYFWDALGKLAKRKPLIKTTAVFYNCNHHMYLLRYSNYARKRNCKRSKKYRSFRFRK